MKNVIIRTKTNLIQDSSDSKSFRELQEAIFCSILIFNKRRVGELQRMTLSSFLDYSKAPASSSEFEKALTEAEKILFKTLKRIVIRGKRGRGVPVLLTPKIVESIDYATTLRSNFKLDGNPYLFGIPGTENPITGNAVMRKHAKIALGDVNKSNLLTSTRLRKQLATVVQILNMNKNELEQLATFMGHTERTHSEFYRLPDDVYQTAKVSKLLLLAKHNSIEQFKGRSLNDIEINANLPEEDEENSDDYIDTESNIDEEEMTANTVLRDETNRNKSTTLIRKGLKRTLVPWTMEQKKYTDEFFKNHIKMKKVPKKHEVMALIEKYPTIFDNKGWAVIKVYVHNKFKQK